MRAFISASLLLVLGACGQVAAPADADAQPTASATAEVSEAEKSAILAALSLSANPQGQVRNECGDMVTPQFFVTDLGSGVGRAVAFVIGGGPSAAACYGDGSLVQLMRNENGAWREIYQVRGGMMIILSTAHNGANDLAAGGGGFSFPVAQWNGAAYVGVGRTVADSELGDARFVPN